jgi:hypothetical protein
MPLTLPFKTSSQAAQAAFVAVENGFREGQMPLTLPFKTSSQAAQAAFVLEAEGFSPAALADHASQVIRTQKTPKSTTSGQHDHVSASNAKEPHSLQRCELAAAKKPSAAPTAMPTTCSSCSRIFFHPDYDRRPWIHTSVCLAARGARLQVKS